MSAQSLLRDFHDRVWFVVACAGAIHKARSDPNRAEDWWHRPNLENGDLTCVFGFPGIEYPFGETRVREPELPAAMKGALATVEESVVGVRSALAENELRDLLTDLHELVARAELVARPDVNPSPECAAAIRSLLDRLNRALSRLRADAAILKTPRRRKRATIKRDEANLRAREALKGKPPKGKRRWTQRTLADTIGCADGQVENLPAWQAYAKDHGLKREKGQAAPKAVSLTPALLANEGRDDEELQRLMAEQKADSEPSPLVPGPRKRRPRRPKL